MQYEASKPDRFIIRSLFNHLSFETLRALFQPTENCVTLDRKQQKMLLLSLKLMSPQLVLILIQLKNLNFGNYYWNRFCQIFLKRAFTILFTTKDFYRVVTNRSYSVISSNLTIDQEIRLSSCYLFNGDQKAVIKSQNLKMHQPHVKSKLVNLRLFVL